MKNKSSFQENMEKWKSLANIEEQGKFLEQMKNEINKKNPKEFRESLKDIHNATIQLHNDVSPKFKA